MEEVKKILMEELLREKEEKRVLEREGSFYGGSRLETKIDMAVEH